MFLQCGVDCCNVLLAQTSFSATRRCANGVAENRWRFLSQCVARKSPSEILSRLSFLVACIFGILLHREEITQSRRQTCCCSPSLLWKFQWPRLSQHQDSKVRGLVFIEKSIANCKRLLLQKTNNRDDGNRMFLLTKRIKPDRHLAIWSH